MDATYRQVKDVDGHVQGFLWGRHYGAGGWLKYY